MKVGLSGEVRFSVTDGNGNITIDTGYQKNLVLDQGLDFFGGGKGSYFNAYCLIGAGNSSPVATQVELDSLIKSSPSIDTTRDYTYTDDGDGLYKFWEERKYRFDNLGAVNISEVGLASEYKTTSDYYLTTRTLVKDSLGSPTTISLKDGETLDVFYKVYKQIPTEDITREVIVSDGDLGAENFNVTLRTFGVGSTLDHQVTSPLSISNNLYATSLMTLSSLELNPITHKNNDTTHSAPSNGITSAPYVKGSFKTTYKYTIGIDSGNLVGGIRTVSTWTTGTSTRLMAGYPLQIRLGSTVSDSTLIKTDKYVLEIPVEISWGRVEEGV